MSALVKFIQEQSVFNQEELLYVGRSKMLLALLNNLHLTSLYDPVLNIGKKSLLEEESLSHSKRLAEVQQIKLAYSIPVDSSSVQEKAVLLEGITETHIKPRELVIYPFVLQYQSDSSILTPTRVERLLSSDNSQGGTVGEISILLSKI